MRFSDPSEIKNPILRAQAEAQLHAEPPPRSRRPRRSGMTDAEVRYARVLESRKLAGEIRDYQFEGEKLPLAQRCVYTPDFVVHLLSGKIEYHEVKGRHVWEDSRIKFKFASRIYPNNRFVWAAWKGNHWEREAWIGGWIGK